MLLIDHIKHFIRSKKILTSGDTVAIGVSGGADSVALALILNDLKHELGIGIHIAHFNHGLRNESGRDETFVLALAQKFNIPCVIGKSSVDLKSLPGSLEDNAREARMNFLIQTAEKVSATKIALAHHKDDLAETVLMRILRGAGLQGMQAIRPVRILKGMTFVRPLLCVDRREIEGYLKERGQDFCHDATNEQTDFTRNRVRHDLLPILKKNYNPNIVSALANFSEIVSDDYECLEVIARRALKHVILERADDRLNLLILALREHPVALQRLMLRLAVQELKGDLNQVDFSHWLEVEDLMANRPDQSIVHWPSGVWIQKQKSSLIVGITRSRS